MFAMRSNANHRCIITILFTYITYIIITRKDLLCMSHKRLANILKAKIITYSWIVKSKVFPFRPHPAFSYNIRLKYKCQIKMLRETYLEQINLITAWGISLWCQYSFLVFVFDYTNPKYLLHFQTSLTSLMTTLSQAHPYFVRCIKPNGSKVSYWFVDNSLRNLGRHILSTKTQDVFHHVTCMHFKILRQGVSGYVGGKYYASFDERLKR